MEAHTCMGGALRPAAAPRVRYVPMLRRYPAATPPPPGSDATLRALRSLLPSYAYQLVDVSCVAVLPSEGTGVVAKTLTAPTRRPIVVLVHSGSVVLRAPTKTFNVMLLPGHMVFVPVHWTLHANGAAAASFTWATAARLGDSAALV